MKNNGSWVYVRAYGVLVGCTGRSMCNGFRGLGLLTNCTYNPIAATITALWGLYLGCCHVTEEGGWNYSVRTGSKGVVNMSNFPELSLQTRV